MEVMKTFDQKCSNDDFGLTFIFLWQDKICYSGFQWEEFLDCVEDLGAKVNKCS